MISSDQASVGVRLGAPYHRVLSILAARKGESIKNLIEEVLRGSEEVMDQARAEGIDLAPVVKEGAQAA